MQLNLIRLSLVYIIDYDVAGTPNFLERIFDHTLCCR